MEVPEGTLGSRGTEFQTIVSKKQKQTSTLLIGPGKNNTLGLRPGAVLVGNKLGSTLLNNPYSVSTSQNIAGGAANNANTKINMGEMGTLEFHKSGGTSAVAAWDDKLPAANEESWHSLTGAAGGASAIMSGEIGRASCRERV